MTPVDRSGCSASSRTSPNASKLKNALRQSENQLRLALDTMPAMVWTLLPEGPLISSTSAGSITRASPWRKPSRIRRAQFTRTTVPSVMEKWGDRLCRGKDV